MSFSVAQLQEVSSSGSQAGQARRAPSSSSSWAGWPERLPVASGSSSGSETTHRPGAAASASSAWIQAASRAASSWALASCSPGPPIGTIYYPADRGAGVALLPAGPPPGRTPARPSSRPPRRSGPRGSPPPLAAIFAPRPELKRIRGRPDYRATIWHNPSTVNGTGGRRTWAYS